MLYTVLAILFFGILIASHEAGHMFAAKACGVQVNEYAIGMGPVLWSTTKGETRYSLRLFPLGGYCAIEGEGGSSDNPRALCSQSVLKQIFVFAAGVTVNFITGFLIVAFTYAGAETLITPEVVSMHPESPYAGEQWLMPGDELYAVNGTRIYLYSDVPVVLAATGSGPNGRVTMTVKRDGVLLDRVIEKVELTDSEGEKYFGYGISYGGETPATPALKLKYSILNTVDFVRIVWFNVKIIANGSAGLDDLRGAVGIVSEITKVGEETEAVAGVSAAVSDVLYFIALIAVNLAVMNLLPIPALDGGHIVVLLLDKTVEKLFHRNINRKALGAVTFASFVLLLGLMGIITVKDIVRILV